jgi:hypothetical protein
MFVFWAVFWGAAAGVGFLLAEGVQIIAPEVPWGWRFAIGGIGAFAFALTALMYGEKKDRFNRLFFFVQNWAILIAAIIGAFLGHFWNYPHVYSSDEAAFRRITHRLCSEIVECRAKAAAEAERRDLSVQFPKR